MTKKRIILCAVIAVLFISLIVPGLIYRTSFEQTTKVYTAAVDLTRLAKFFNSFDLPRVLEDYRQSGATTAVITETRGLYSEEHLQLAKNAGLNIALVPDVTVGRDADIDRICREYKVKYIKLQRGLWRDVIESNNKTKPICDAIKNHGLTVVISETGMQLSNIEVKNLEKYMKAADGRIARNFNSYYTTNIEVMDYPAIYYQIYNSAYDRNTRFITVKQLEDKGFSADENASRTQENIRLFCDKMDSHGFVSEGDVDYRNYKSVNRAVSGAAAAISVLMAAFMAELLIPGKIKKLFEISLVAAAVVFAASLLLPRMILELYPTLFAILAPCFALVVCAKLVEAIKDKFSFIPLLLITAGTAIALFAINGAIISALLTGPEYMLNTYTFRGVKLTLMAPMGFAALMLIGTVYKKLTVSNVKSIIKKSVKNIRWYHLLLAVALIGVVVLYLKRSGNVSTISFSETYIRNWLTEYFTARPRTKEILLAWPCFALYIYYVKKNKAKLLQWIFAMGASMLFASTINTFCHVFTLTETMFLRIATGVLFGGVITIAVLIVNHIGFSLVTSFMSKKQQKNGR